MNSGPFVAFSRVVYSILDSIGYLLTAGALFFPVFWFIIYFIRELFYFRRYQVNTVFLEPRSLAPVRSVDQIKIQAGKAGTEKEREAA